MVLVVLVFLLFFSQELGTAHTLNVKFRFDGKNSKSTFYYWFFIDDGPNERLHCLLLVVIAARLFNVQSVEMFLFSHENRLCMKHEYSINKKKYLSKTR